MRSRRGGSWTALVLVALLGAAVARAEEALPRLMVLDFQEQGAGPQVASALGGVASHELQRLGIFQVSTSEALRELLALARQQQMLGCTDEGACATELASTLGVDYLVTGKVSRVPAARGMPPTITLELTLLEVKKAQRVGTDVRVAQSESELLGRVRPAVLKLVSRVLQGRTGTLFVSVTEPGAVVKVDDAIQGTAPLPGRLSLPAGPHLLSVEKEGFVAVQKEVRVRADAHQEEAVVLVPSPDFIREYQARNARLRTGAWLTSGVALGGLAAAGFFQWQALQTYGTAEAPDTFEYHRARVLAGIEEDAEGNHRLEAQRLKASIESSQRLSWVSAGVGGAAAAAAAFFWLVGEDPQRYQRFTTVSVEPTPGGATAQVHGTF